MIIFTRKSQYEVHFHNDGGLGEFIVKKVQSAEPTPKVAVGREFRGEFLEEVREGLPLVLKKKGRIVLSTSNVTGKFNEKGEAI